MLTLFSALATATPMVLPHQARLLDTVGDPLEGTYQITVSLHDAPSDGNTEWTRSYPSVPVVDGYVSLTLADGTPSLDSDLFDGSDIWLQMSVDNAPILPRTQVGHALYAAHASSVTGPIQATEVRVGNTVVIDAQGRVHGRGPTDLVCGSGQSPVHNGTDWTCAANTRTNAEIEGVAESITLDATVGFTVGGYSVADSQNVRAIVSKGTANSYCTGEAIHVPWSYRGQTGSQICAADARNRTTCTGVKYVYVTNGNGYGRYTPSDLGCSSPVHYPWPWGNSYNTPNTLSSEWGHGDTYVVCCN